VGTYTSVTAAMRFLLCINPLGKSAATTVATNMPSLGSATIAAAPC